MHLAFVDITYDYTADRPDSDWPLGGTTSAMCFLARELVKRGVACTFFNKVERPAAAHGIPSLPLEALIEERANPAYAAFIVNGRWTGWLVDHIREKARVPIIAWMHESAFGTKFTQALPAFDGVAFVSEWQQRINQPHVPPRWKQAVLRNAMNPLFVGLFPPGAPVLAAKTAAPPVLLYAGMTPRGALHLPGLLDALRPRRSDFSLEIYCDCSPSQDPQVNETYINWMRNLPNVAHVGMVAQKELAQRMKRAAIFLSPNPWPETSCIALIEAMAAGLCAITTNRGALPETGAAFPRHIAVEDADHPSRHDMPIPYDIFAAAIDETLDRRLQRRDKMENALRAQIGHFRAAYQWPQRAAPWIEFVRSFRQE